ncbi:MAG: hypothetical protein CMK06_13420 [Ponticaulis sp.]|nr:hypothetical protein [Ponticaulis sp.]
MTDPPIREDGAGTLITVRVTPKSSRDGIDGVGEDDAGRRFLKIRVRAIPDNGAANKAVCQLLAKQFGIPKSSVELASGATSRLKQIRIDRSECEIETLLARLADMK